MRQGLMRLIFIVVCCTPVSGIAQEGAPASASTGSGKLITSLSVGENLFGVPGLLLVLEEPFTAYFCGEQRTSSVVVIPDSLDPDVKQDIQSLVYISLTTRTAVTFVLDTDSCTTVFGVYPHATGASLVTF
jgi:hypothetical protein